MRALRYPRLSTGWLRPGQHTIKAVADSNNQVAESDETNNEKTLNLSTIVPDLLIQNITWSPTEASAGDTVTFTVKTKNQGSDKAINPRVAFYIDGSSIGAQDIPQINAGALVTNTFTWTATTGSHDIKATVDPDNVIIESNEANNTKNLTLSLPATKKAANPTAKPTNQSENKGILGNMWWLLCIGVVVLGGIAFIAAMKSAKR